VCGPATGLDKVLWMFAVSTGRVTDVSDECSSFIFKVGQVKNVLDLESSKLTWPETTGSLLLSLRALLLSAKQSTY
jgi:hypothetical protein